MVPDGGNIFGLSSKIAQLLDFDGNGIDIYILQCVILVVIYELFYKFRPSDSSQGKYAGTRTEKNLETAFAGESMARMEARLVDVEQPRLRIGLQLSVDESLNRKLVLTVFLCRYCN